MTQKPAKRRVWIDTDPAMTTGNGEVDDGFALIQALRSVELDIVGISAVFGNTDTEHAFAMTKEIVKRAGRLDIPVYRGCKNAADHQINAATKALCTAIDDAPLSILALGPLTTIATALAQPGLALGNVREIIFVGGRRKGVEFYVTKTQQQPFRDMNFELDVDAVKNVLALNIPMTLAGWEVSSNMWITPSDLDQLTANDDACVQWLAATSRNWQASWQSRFNAPGFIPFDTLAVGWLLRPELFAVHHWPCGVVHNEAGPLLLVDPTLKGAMTTYLHTVDHQAFRVDLMARLLGDV